MKYRVLYNAPTHIAGVRVVEPYSKPMESEQDAVAEAQRLIAEGVTTQAAVYQSIHFFRAREVEQQVVTVERKTIPVRVSE